MGSAAPTFEVVRRAPCPALAGTVLALTGYRETAAAILQQREAAPLRVPFIVSFGTPFAIALGRPAGPGDVQGSFAAGLYAGPVNILSDGRAACVQVDFTPLGAVRLFGGALAELAGRMVALDAIFGPPGRALVERLGATPDWPTRFTLVEDFVLARLRHAPSPEIAFAWDRLARRGGGGSVAALATEIGWSRQRLHARCRAELGLAPKALARLMRFNRACTLARRQGGAWADVAAEAGYADQPHLVRDFRALAGEAPSAWARRVAAKDSRLRDAEG